MIIKLFGYDACDATFVAVNVCVDYLNMSAYVFSIILRILAHGASSDLSLDNLPYD